MKTRISNLIGALIAGMLLAVVLVSAQEAQPPQPAQGPMPQEQPRAAQPMHPPMDPLGGLMFPPDIIMQHQRELGLTDEQKTFMRGEINRVTTRFNELQWQLQDAMEALHETMKANPVNEQQALAQLSKVLDAEREIKTLHLELAIRIKNKLTPEQQEKLHTSIHMMMGPGGGPGDGPRPRGGPGRGPGAPGTPPPGPAPRPEGQPPTDVPPIF